MEYDGNIYNGVREEGRTQFQVSHHTWKKKILFTVSLKDSFFFCAYVIQDMYKFLEIFNYQNAIYKQIISSW